MTPNDALGKQMSDSHIRTISADEASDEKTKTAEATQNHRRLVAAVDSLSRLFGPLIYAQNKVLTNAGFRPPSQRQRSGTGIAINEMDTVKKTAATQCAVFGLSH